MRSALSQEDQENLNKALRIYEKEARYEPMYRWLFLVVALLLMAGGLYSSSRAEHFSDAFDNSVHESLQEHEEAILIDKILQVKVDLLRAEFIHSRNSLDFAVGAALFFAAALFLFARRHIDRSQVLLLKALLEEQGRTPNKSSNTDAGEAGAG